MPQHIKQIAEKARLLVKNGQLKNALKFLTKILHNNPHYELFFIRANILKSLSQPKKALEDYSSALSINPRASYIYVNRGILFSELNQTTNALKDFELAISTNPKDHLAYFNRGKCFQKLKKYHEAIQSFAKAIEISPYLAAAHMEKGVSHFKSAENDLAISHFNESIKLSSNYYEAYLNRSLVFTKNDQFNEAINDLKIAITIDSEEAKGFYNLALNQTQLGDYISAKKNYEIAILKNNEFVSAHLNLSMIYLTLGEYEKGFYKYEWKWKTKTQRGRKLYQPKSKPRLTQNKKLIGKSILIYSDEGLGDAIQFSRFINPIIHEKARVVLLVQEPLISLFKSSNLKCEIIGKSSKIPYHDYYAPMSSLPNILNTNETKIPHPVEFKMSSVRSNSALDLAVKQKNKPAIGIAWRGNPDHTNDKNRSIDLDVFLGNLDQNYEYISLQKELTKTEYKIISNQYGILDSSPLLVDMKQTANLCNQLDLIITVDTSIAHLCGSMKKPTWVLIPFVPDWRWQLERSDSPWYPSIKLFRQKEKQNWTDVFIAVNNHLKSLFPK